MMLILLIHEHSMCFHLFVFFQFSSVSYNFLSAGHLYSYFILFIAIVNEIVFLISLSVSLLLSYKMHLILDINFASCYFAEFIYEF